MFRFRCGGTTGQAGLVRGVRSTPGHDEVAGCGQRGPDSVERTASSGQRRAGSGKRAAASGQRQAGSGKRAAGSLKRAAVSGQRAAVSGQRGAGVMLRVFVDRGLVVPRSRAACRYRVGRCWTWPCWAASLGRVGRRRVSRCRAGRCWTWPCRAACLGRVGRCLTWLCRAFCRDRVGRCLPWLGVGLGTGVFGCIRCRRVG